MWEHLKQEQKEKYKTLITNFASLSEAFSQKAEADEKNSTEDIVFKELFKQLERILQIPPMMLRLSLMRSTNISSESNHLVLIQATKRLLSLRKTHSLGMNY